MVSKEKAVRKIESEDVLDLIKLKEEYANKNEFALEDLESQTMVHNPYGGFRVEFVNNYIVDYMLCPKG